MTFRALLLPLVLLAAPLGGAEGPIDDACDAAGSATDVGCLPQADGGSPGDASGTCAQPSPEVHPGAVFHGTLVPPDDVEDDYALVVDVVGTPLTIHVTSLPGAPPATAPSQHRVTLWSPDFQGEPQCAEPLGQATPGAPLTFVPDVPGKYVLQVQPHPTAPLPPQARMCHYMCVVQNATAYVISIQTP